MYNYTSLPFFIYIVTSGLRKIYFVIGPRNALKWIRSYLTVSMESNIVDIKDFTQRQTYVNVALFTECVVFL